MITKRGDIPLQNIPIRTELGSEIRKSFPPKDGYVYVNADYSSLEMRIYADLCEKMGLTEDDIESNLETIMSPRPQPQR